MHIEWPASFIANELQKWGPCTSSSNRLQPGLSEELNVSSMPCLSNPAWINWGLPEDHTRFASGVIHIRRLCVCALNCVVLSVWSFTAHFEWDHRTCCYCVRYTLLFFCCCCSGFTYYLTLDWHWCAALMKFSPRKGGGYLCPHLNDRSTHGEVVSHLGNNRAVCFAGDEKSVQLCWVSLYFLLLTFLIN